MPSEKAVRRWMVLAVVLVWGVIVLMVWDQRRWARVVSVEDVLHHRPRTTLLLVGTSIGGVCLGALVLTRLVYCALREHRGNGRDA